MSNSLEDEPNGFEAPWADMSNDSNSERDAWEEYNDAKQRVHAMIQDESYENAPGMALKFPSLIL
eukprot:374449-Pleurochrysis_carterae.AAC.1